MSGEFKAALDNVKRDEAALRRAYLDCGGKIGDGRNHNSCPICGDSSGLSLSVDQAGRAVWTCYAGKGACATAPGKTTGGTIVDLLMRVRKIESAAACKLAVERYGKCGLKGTARRTAPKHQGKLHLSVDAAIEAYTWGLTQRPNIASAKLNKFWKYTDERGEPKFVTARFDVVKKDGAHGKEFVPIRREGNGWRVGLGPWGKAGKSCPLYRLPEIMAAVGS